MLESVLGAKDAKKQWKKEAKEKNALADQKRPKVFVLDFEGDIAATSVSALREEVTALLGVAEPQDEVVLRLESAGGVVHGYGLAASQLQRLRDKGLKLTVCVDKVAASGGYMMACVGHVVLAAPFAVVGSIGVVASVPNIHRLLERAGVDYTEETAGEFKRTVSFLGEISEEGRKKFREQLEDTHRLFKTFVVHQRPSLDIAKVSTGEHWFGTRAVELSLVDGLMTSDDYLMQKSVHADVFCVSYDMPVSLKDKILHSTTSLGKGLYDALMQSSSRRFFV
jgi:serine protease SohB